MFKFIYHVREGSESLSFWGGIISSFGCTIIYEAINKLPMDECSFSFVLEWVSAALMMTACFLFIVLSSKIGRINDKFIVLLSCATDAEKSNSDEIMKLAIKSAFNLQSSRKIVRKALLIQIQFICAVLLTILSFAILYMSRFV